MSASKKLASTLANAAAGAATYVDDVFSTYLYEGNGSTQTITNGIDLSGEGGLVWIKSRDATYSHMLHDTERGATNYLQSDQNYAEATYSGVLSAFNSDGFTIGSATGVNNTGTAFASWTFRKAPGFFDVVTYTGTGSPHNISHNLGCKPGAIFIKCTSNAQNWGVWHKGTSTPADDYLHLNLTSGAGTSSAWWDSTLPTSTHFTVGAELGPTNLTGWTYVAYLFADGDDADAQIFGADGDQAVVKCGSYTGNGSSTGPEINLGFEPQWLLVKNASASGGWQLMDTMRGLPVGAPDLRLEPHTSNAEASISSPGFVDPQPTGFQVTSTGTNMNGSGSTYIYIAIRRPHKPAESGTEVFAIDDKGEGGSTATDPAHNSGFVADMAIRREIDYASNNFTSARLISGKWLRTNLTDAESTSTQPVWDYMDGFREVATASTNDLAWMFKRSPGFFDVVTWTGSGVTEGINHNLGVVPEMIIAKSRETTNQFDEWAVYHTGISAAKHLQLQSAAAVSTMNPWGGTHTDTVFYGHQNFINYSGYKFIAYLFASQDGISKVGSYTGNGSSQTINCGFSSGARFVLIKRTDSTSNWNLFDTERGIIAGNSSRLELNTTDFPDTGDDGIDPDSSGFAVNYVATDDDDVNVSGGTYIYLAIA